MLTINTTYPFSGCADTRQGGRVENQDTCATSDTALGLLVLVCDGMGGGPSGKLASTLAARAIITTVAACEGTEDRVEILRNAVLNANYSIFQAMETDPSLKGMGTTVTALLINEWSAVVAHVGDSRVYQLRGGKKIFRTFDHSMVFELVRQGSLSEEQARLSANSNIITRALGHSTDLMVDVVELPYEKGDRFMLCTDGIWGMFPEKEIVKIAAKTASLPGAVESLVIKVDEEGMATGAHHDNLTVAMVEVNKKSLKKETMSKKSKIIFTVLAAVCVLSLAANAWMCYMLFLK